jgi:MHS family proline/betaine transporter-like MFS transporter
MVLLTLFGATAGQGVVWYTGQYYALTFMSKTCAIDGTQVNQLLMIAIVAVTPFFVLFGWLSDRIGRKGIMLAGMLIAILAYRPIYRQMFYLADLTQKQEITNQARTEEATETKGSDQVTTVKTSRAFTDGTSVAETKITTVSGGASLAPKEETTRYVTLGSGAFWQMTFLVFIQIFFVTMVYGPIAAFLVEVFPTRIRYTSMSLPYHIGNGIFGGLTPYIASRIVEANKGTSETYYMDGLWYPIAIAAVSFLIGLVYLSNKAEYDIGDD